MSDQISALIRHAMTAFGGALGAGGYLTSDQWTSAAGALTILAGVAWSIISKRMANIPATPGPATKSRS
jgi:hypothetical protein